MCANVSTNNSVREGRAVNGCEMALNVPASLKGKVVREPSQVWLMSFRVTDKRVGTKSAAEPIAFGKRAARSRQLSIKGGCVL